MKITLQLIENELRSLNTRLDTISLFASKGLPTKEEITKETLQRRDDLLFERDEIFKLQKKQNGKDNRK